jgi:uncharacterized Rossmann fold enzyme
MICKFNQLQEYINGKSVAVVGNAESLLSKNQGNEIDAHDVVIRFNKGCQIINSKHQGTKNDITILQHFLIRHKKYHINNRHLKKCKYVLHIFNETEFTKDAHNITQIPNSIVTPILLKFTSQLGDPAPGEDIIGPTNGGLCIALLSSKHFEPSKITLFGFDFKKTKSVTKIRQKKEPRIGEKHNYFKEEDYIRKLSKNHNIEIK